MRESCSFATREPPDPSTRLTAARTFPRSCGPGASSPGQSATSRGTRSRSSPATSRPRRRRRPAPRAVGSRSSPTGSIVTWATTPTWRRCGANAELADAVAAAHAEGARVTAHTFATESIDGLLGAGIDSIEHGTGMTAAHMERAAAAGRSRGADPSASRELRFVRGPGGGEVSRLRRANAAHV